MIDSFGWGGRKNRFGEDLEVGAEPNDGMFLKEHPAFASYLWLPILGHNLCR